MADQTGNVEVMRGQGSDLDFDGERDVTEGEFEEGLPSELDASFEEPVPDVIDQRRTVLLEADGYDA